MLRQLLWVGGATGFYCENIVRGTITYAAFLKLSELRTQDMYAQMAQISLCPMYFMQTYFATPKRQRSSRRPALPSAGWHASE